jgi:hypothetical protein
VESQKSQRRNRDERLKKNLRSPSDWGHVIKHVISGIKNPDLDSFQLTVALMAFAIGYAELREILIKNICGKADK